MGSGGSLMRHNDEDDVVGEYDGTGVIKKIPIEVKPRPKLGKGLGLRSVSSIGKSAKGGSLRSALSVDLEDPEITKIKREYEMFRINKDNELSNMKKKVQKLDTENKRLRNEMRLLQQTCKKLREERDLEQETRHQLMMRAASFENDRDKIQRQFKIFRETKESEIQNLLKNRRVLEGRLINVGVDEFDGGSRIDGATSGENWPWGANESEPSLGSLTQLHAPVLKGLEFAHSLMEIDGPFMNVSKEDWNQVAATLAQMNGNTDHVIHSSFVKVFVSVSTDAVDFLARFKAANLDSMGALCRHEGRFLVWAECRDRDVTTKLEHCARRSQIDESSIVLILKSGALSRQQEGDIEHAKTSANGSRSVVVVEVDSELDADLDSDVKVTPASGLNKELTALLRLELGVDNKGVRHSVDSLQELEGQEMLCGGCIWDPNHDSEQVVSRQFALRSSCELGFEKYYERLDAHVSAAGPLPPILISGPAGSGRSLLLNKWLQLQQQRTPNCLVLQHSVSGRHTCSADPNHLLRRFMTSLSRHVSLPLHGDPARLREDFPRWLERVSSKTPGGVLMLLDAADHVTDAESSLDWLLDPLPVDTRVLVTASEADCPPSWLSWPTIHLQELTNKNVKELLRAELASEDLKLGQGHETEVLTHCRTAATCSPLYTVLLAQEVIYQVKHSGNIDDSNVDNTETDESDTQLGDHLKHLLKAASNVELLSLIIESIQTVFEARIEAKELLTTLLLVQLSHEGLREMEICEMMNMDWELWFNIRECFILRQILLQRDGFMIFAHSEVSAAVTRLLGNNNSIVDEARLRLAEYFQNSMKPGMVTYRVADELPWLYEELGQLEQLHNTLLNLCVFTILYAKGRCAEIIRFWQVMNCDKSEMVEKYLSATKGLEEKVGQLNGLITLPAVADLYETLGRFMRDLALLREAQKPLQKALEIRETALDPDHPSVARALHLIGGLHAQWGKLASAEQYYTQALEVYEGSCGAEHPLVGKELHALAAVYQRQGKHAAAEPLLRRAAAIKRATGAPRAHSAQLRTMTPLRKRVLALEGLTMGADSLELAKTLNEIGVLHYLQGDTRAAESFISRALQMRESVGGLSHPDVAQSLNNLAAIHAEKKQWTAAEGHYARAMEIRQANFGPEHPARANIARHLAAMYERTGKLDLAEPLLREALQLRVKAFGESHPSVATAQVNLAVVLCQLRNLEAAQPLFEDALHIYQDIFGSNHPRVAETLTNLAKLKYELGDFQTAAKLYKQATEISDVTGRRRHESNVGSDTTSTVKL